MYHDLLVRFTVSGYLGGFCLSAVADGVAVRVAAPVSQGTRVRAADGMKTHLFN